MLHALVHFLGDQPFFHTKHLSLGEFPIKTQLLLTLLIFHPTYILREMIACSTFEKKQNLLQAPDIRSYKVLKLMLNNINSCWIKGSQNVFTFYCHTV